MDAGGTPNFATTPASSKIVFVRRLSCTTRVAAHALREVLVGRADDHAFDARIGGRGRGRGGERVVGFEFDHRPHDDPLGRERLFEQRKLREQRGFDALAGFVAGPESVAERLDDVIGRDADVRRAVAHQAAHRGEDAAHGRDLAAFGVARRRQREEVAKQFVGAVDEVNVHRAISA